MDAFDDVGLQLGRSRLNYGFLALLIMVRAIIIGNNRPINRRQTLLIELSAHFFLVQIRIKLQRVEEIKRGFPKK